MEKITLDHDITVFCVKAATFPDGIMDAYNKLHALTGDPRPSRYYGLSRPEKGVVTYYAAAEELEPGEGEKLGCQTIVIKKGQYISETIEDYIRDLANISTVFQKLLAILSLDPNGYCVEWYFNEKDVQCMVCLEQ